MTRLYRRLFIPDTHAPMHDKKAWACMLKVAADFKPDEVVYLGDFWDCYCVSDYTKNPTTNFKMLEEELVDGRNLLKEVERATKAKSFVFLQGNHEERIDRYIAVYAAKLAGCLETRKILQVPDSYKWFPYGMKNIYRMGKLLATHGSLCGQYPAAAMARKYGCSVIFGHTHKVQELQLRNASGEIFRGINIGWLGDIETAAEYVKNVTDWCHGFAVGWFNDAGDFWIQIIPIVDYQCVFNGSLFSQR